MGEKFGFFSVTNRPKLVWDLTTISDQLCAFGSSFAHLSHGQSNKKTQNFV